MTSFRDPTRLLDDVLAIWRAGVGAVASDRLVREQVRVAGHWLHVADDRVLLENVRRIVVVGGGKAGAGMAAGLEAALGEQVLAAKQVAGWLNVPDDCVRPLKRIHLHGARPAGINEPTAAGVDGADRMLKLVRHLGPRDVCFCLLSGGGSALMPAPVAGISLDDKRQVTQFLSAAGANIAELNTVRKSLSRIKGGRLARACSAGRLFTLILSDVIGDPLDVIASGPTVPNTTTPRDALAVLDKYQGRSRGVSPRVFAYLEWAVQKSAREGEPFGCDVQNFVIGNNAAAVDAAGMEAERRGFSHAMQAARTLEGPAEDVGRHLAAMAWQMRDAAARPTESSGQNPDCLITGGEPVVQLAEPAVRGRGGRNQQLVLAALEQLLAWALPTDALADIVLLSGGTDGEDGPTDAAGAFINEAVVRAVRAAGLQPAEYLRRNDAYTFFQQVGGLLRTGPTHTNVCDLRVVAVSAAS